MKSVISKILKYKFHMAALITIFVSLLFTFLKYDLTVFRFANSAVHLKKSFVHWFKVAMQGQAEWGTTYGVFSSTKYLDMMNILPFDTGDIIFKLKNTWHALFIGSNFQLYLLTVMYKVLVTFIVLMLVYMFYNVFSLIIGIKLYDYAENGYEKTKALIFFEEKISAPLSYVFSKLISFLTRFRNSWYFFVFILIWCFNLNLLTLLFELVAWFAWFSVAPGVSSILQTVATLILDFIIMFTSAPVVFWLCIGVVIFYIWRKSVGKDRLDHMYLYDMGFSKSLAYNVLLDGPTGSSKTKTLVQMSIMKEDQFHTDEWDSMHEIHVHFPDFPFERFQAEIDKQIEEHYIFSMHTARNFVFMRMTEHIYNRVPENIWGYTGRLTYDDSYRYVSIWEELNDYVQLYYMYSNDTSCILANFSIRTDLKKIPGYMPLWDNNMLDRKPELFEEYTRYCHIDDYDTMRYSKPMDPENKNIGAVDYGVRIKTELDKDRGNQNTNKVFDINSEQANSLNDGFGKYLMMERHEASVRFKCYVWNGADMQRVENFKAGESSLYDVLNIYDNSKMKIALPLFLERGALERIIDWYKNFDKMMFHYGKRNTLPYYLVTKIIAPIERYFQRTVALFGYEKIKFARTKACSKTGEVDFHDYFLIYAIIHNNRYASDCYSLMSDEISKSAEHGLIDMPVFEGKKPMTYEFSKMKSYFADEQLERIKRRKRR